MNTPVISRVSRLVPFKHRLMTAEDCDNGNGTVSTTNPTASLASEIRTYANGLEVKFDRSYFSKNGSFTVVAVDANSGDLLAFREAEKRYDDALRSIERSLKI